MRNHIVFFLKLTFMYFKGFKAVLILSLGVSRIDVCAVFVSLFLHGSVRGSHLDCLLCTQVKDFEMSILNN